MSVGVPFTSVYGSYNNSDSFKPYDDSSDESRVVQALLYGVLCGTGPLMYGGYRMLKNNPDYRRKILYAKLIWTGIKSAVRQRFTKIKENIFGVPKCSIDQIDLNAHVDPGAGAYAVMKPSNLEDLMNDD